MIRLKHITGDLAIYFNWSCNAVLPITAGAADHYLKCYRDIIYKVANQLILFNGFNVGTIYRGIILREPAQIIAPNKHMQYLSFSTDRKVAEHFADVNGFGSDLVNVSQQLGKYGYVIEYKPAVEEILFHHQLLNVLPYAEAFSLIVNDGQGEVDSLKKQKEIMIKQPAAPFTTFKPFEAIQLQKQII